MLAVAITAAIAATIAIISLLGLREQRRMTRAIRDLRDNRQQDGPPAQEPADREQLQLPETPAGPCADGGNGPNPGHGTP